MKIQTILLTLLLLTGYSAAAPGEQSFTGRIILVDGNRVEIKRGRKEITFTMTEKTRVLKNSAETGRQSLALCQKATARYTVQGKNFLLESISIVRESDCLR